MKVNTLLQNAGLPKGKINHDVYKLCQDSRQCIENSVFVAIDGNHVNAKIFIQDAIHNGAKTIIVDSYEEKQEGINYIMVEDTRKVLSLLAKIFYKDVSKKICLIGVIGTNGKTTTSSIGYSFFNSIQRRSMLIGSNGVFFTGYEARIYNTTPDILTIYQYLSLAKRKHISYVFMEISSIAVDQYRVYGLTFHTLIFTNFSQDHLDYHKTMEKYLYCKLIPFIKLKRNAYAVLNMDDKAYKTISKYCDAKIVTYGCVNKGDFLATLNTITEQGISFYARDILFQSKLLGEFNVYNALAILSLCDIFKIPVESFKEFLSHFESVSGRMNHISFQNKHVIIDYAHTYQATKRVIEEGLKLCKGKLHIVLGCGGNREKEKRFMIGSLLNEISAQIILTTDNPRFEDPNAILQDIQANLTKEVLVIPDRRKAIEVALKNLSTNDYLLVLGKGCENYMDIRGVKYPYSDMEVIHDWIQLH